MLLSYNFYEKLNNLLGTYKIADWENTKNNMIKY